MRYTKYNYKKKKNSEVIKFVVSVILMAAFAIVVGVSLAKVISTLVIENNISSGENINEKVVEASSQNSENTDVSTSNNTSSADANSVQVNSSFSLVQCGYFSSEDNAKQALDKIDDKYLAFIVSENDKFRVLTGINTDSESSNTLNELKSSGVECVKMNFMFDSKNEVQNQIAAICDGYLKILNTTFDGENIKFVDTSDFKAWVSNLEVLKEGDNLDILTGLKEYIANAPNEISKDNVAKEMEYMYSILVKFKVK